MNIMFAVNEIINAGTMEGITKSIKALKAEQRFEALKQSALAIDKQVETYLSAGDNKLAIWSLAKLSIIDDMLLNAEREVNQVTSLHKAEAVSH